MLDRSPSAVRGALGAPVIAYAFLLILIGCEAEKSRVDCSAANVSGKCSTVLESYKGFEIGMEKQAAFAIACNLAEEGEIRDPVFLVSGALRAHPGASFCALRTEADASDQWSFIESGLLRERYIMLKFVDNKIASIRKLPRGLDP